tara:strand:+ start:49 stop:828 length:780 start_codon:yes stop_codon:yes gene_type:complete
MNDKKNIKLVSRKGSQSACIVGKSDSLKGKKLGQIIDSHDVVVRVNFPPVLGYEEDVGTKTNHVVLHVMVFRHLMKHQIEFVREWLSRMDAHGGEKKVCIASTNGFWGEDGNSYLAGGNWSLADKKQALEQLKLECSAHGVTVEKHYFSEAVNSINKLCHFFVGRPKVHGLFTGTQTVMDYIGKFTNLSMVGMGNSETHKKHTSDDAAIPTVDIGYYFADDPEVEQKTRKPMDTNKYFEYDVFCLEQCIKRGHVKRLDD